MYLQQTDLTRGAGRDFVDELRRISIKVSYEKRDFLFRRGDPAKHAYLLLIGHVNLKFGEAGHVVHIVNRPGETFGWSSLVGRAAYSATAECMMQTKLRRLHREDLQRLLEKDPTNGLIFFQRLAEMLGDRLLQSYGRYEKLFDAETFV